MTTYFICYDGSNFERLFISSTWIHISYVMIEVILKSCSFLIFTYFICYDRSNLERLSISPLSLEVTDMIVCPDDMSVTASVPDSFSGAICKESMKTWWHGKAFCITGPLWGESTGHRWIPLTKGPVIQIFDARGQWIPLTKGTNGFPSQRAGNKQFWYFLQCYPGQIVKSTLKWLMIWGIMALMRHFRNDYKLLVEDILWWEYIVYPIKYAEFFCTSYPYNFVHIFYIYISYMVSFWARNMFSFYKIWV